MWRPKEGYMEITDDFTSKLRRVEFKDVESAVTHGQRVNIKSPPEGEDEDILDKARKDGWSG